MFLEDTWNVDSSPQMVQLNKQNTIQNNPGIPQPASKYQRVREVSYLLLRFHRKHFQNLLWLNFFFF